MVRILKGIFRDEWDHGRIKLIDTVLFVNLVLYWDQDFFVVLGAVSCTFWLVDNLLNVDVWRRHLYHCLVPVCSNYVLRVQVAVYEPWPFVNCSEGLVRLDTNELRMAAHVPQSVVRSNVDHECKFVDVRILVLRRCLVRVMLIVFDKCDLRIQGISFAVEKLLGVMAHKGSHCSAPLL